MKIIDKTNENWQVGDKVQTELLPENTEGDK